MSRDIDPYWELLRLMEFLRVFEGWWEMLRDVEQCWEMFRDVERYWAILRHIERYWDTPLIPSTPHNSSWKLLHSFLPPLTPLRYAAMHNLCACFHINDICLQHKLAIKNTNSSIRKCLKIWSNKRRVRKYMGDSHSCYYCKIIKYKYRCLL